MEPSANLTNERWKSLRSGLNWPMRGADAASTSARRSPLTFFGSLVPGELNSGGISRGLSVGGLHRSSSPPTEPIARTASDRGRRPPANEAGAMPVPAAYLGESPAAAFASSASLVPPPPINTRQPGVVTSLLYSGSRFRGHQKSKGNSYDVEVVLQVRLPGGGGGVGHFPDAGELSGRCGDLSNGRCGDWQLRNQWGLSSINPPS